MLLVLEFAWFVANPQSKQVLRSVQNQETTTLINFNCNIANLYFNKRESCCVDFAYSTICEFILEEVWFV